MFNVCSRHVSALPSGKRNTDGSFNNAGNNGNWWTATENDAENAYCQRMYNKGYGLSVRCVMNN
jgi:hypothetical protein